MNAVTSTCFLGGVFFSTSNLSMSNVIFMIMIVIYTDGRVNSNWFRVNSKFGIIVLVSRVFEDQPWVFSL